MSTDDAPSPPSPQLVARRLAEILDENGMDGELLYRETKIASVGREEYRISSHDKAVIVRALRYFARNFDGE